MKKNNDEWYTPYYTVNNMLNIYGDYLKDKVVYCNCDEYNKSQFVKCLKDNYDKYNIKTIIATCLKDDHGIKYIYKKVNGSEYEEVTKLTGNGDFMSNECVDILKDIDILITNPPFSKSKNIVEICYKYKKKFIMILPCNIYACDYMYIRLYNNDIITFNTYKMRYFERPNGEIQNISCIWMSNIKNKSVKLRKYKFISKYDPTKECHKNITTAKGVIGKFLELRHIKDIPSDYIGLMSVPMGILIYDIKDEFNLIGKIKLNKGWTRILIKRKVK